MKHGLAIGLLFLCAVASASSFDFEGSVPDGVRVRGRGNVALDTDRYKDGASSLRFSWTGQAELLVSDPEGIDAFMASPKGGSDDVDMQRGASGTSTAHHIPRQGR